MLLAANSTSSGLDSTGMKHSVYIRQQMNPSERTHRIHRENGSNAEDVALIRRMVEADETALGALYDRWVRSLYSLVLHLLKDPDEAEDVVEETFWQAWRKADSYEPSTRSRLDLASHHRPPQGARPIARKKAAAGKTRYGERRVSPTSPVECARSVAGSRRGRS